ncbi:hypothetical protein [Actinoplanes sp. L3-i22]|uniref:hypothetical protein n=1 Tax=Actinoplanes sp. L3-i22 TaxID=2836373 RepID=UPI001C76E6DA|nr:hypothetical protein [Actinoplanes sp. L3-i22]BCY06992.1 hypothetical protein L3i22_020800 [Actinoplanes sp. L3-i22]
MAGDPLTLDDLLAFATDLADEGSRASALAELVPRLPVERLDAVLDVPFTDGYQRGRVLSAVLKQATPAQVERIRSGPLDYYTLIDLLPHLSGVERAAAVERLLVRLERHAEFDLPALIPYLEPGQLDRLIARSPSLLIHLGEHLSAAQLGTLPATVCADPAEYRAVIGRLAPLLDATRLAALAEAVADVRDDGIRSVLLARVAPHLPAPRRTAAIAASVAAAVAAMDAQVKPWNLLDLTDLLPLAGHDQVSALLAAEQAAYARGMNSNFAAIAPFATPAQVAAVFAAAVAPARLGEPFPPSERLGFPMHALVKVIPYLPQNLQDPAVRTILPHLDTGMFRVPRLTPGQAAELLGRMSPETAPWDIARSIDYLTSFMGGQVGAAFNVVLTIGDEVFLGEALTEIAPRLDPAQLATAVRAATGIRDATVRARTLVGLRPDAEQLNAVRSVPDPEDRALLSLELTAALPEPERAAALDAAWRALVTMPTGPGQSVVFKKLLTLLPSG